MLRQKFLFACSTHKFYVREILSGTNIFAHHISIPFFELIIGSPNLLHNFTFSMYVTNTTKKIISNFKIEAKKKKKKISQIFSKCANLTNFIYFMIKKKETLAFEKKNSVLHFL